MSNLIEVFWVAEEEGNGRKDFRLLPGYYDREIQMCREERQKDKNLQQNQTLFSQRTWNIITQEMRDE